MLARFAFGATLAGGFGFGCSVMDQRESVLAPPKVPIAEAADYIPSAAHTKRLPGRTFGLHYSGYQLGKIIPITHDVALFRFLLREGETFNLKPCTTLQACFRLGVQAAEQVERFYTPITANGTEGYFDLIVKRKEDGRMTEHLFGMQPGETLLFRCVNFKITYRANRWKEVGMIAGGTGFTPMLQVIRHALEEDLRDSRGKPDRTKLSFLFCNRNEKNILLKGLFDELAQKYPNRFKMSYCVDNAVDAEKWNGYTGYVTTQMVKEALPEPNDKNICLVCGPDHLLYHVAGTPLCNLNTLSGSRNYQPVAPDLNNGGSPLLPTSVLAKSGWTGDNVYKF